TLLDPEPVLVGRIVRPTQIDLTTGDRRRRQIRGRRQLDGTRRRDVGIPRRPRRIVGPHLITVGSAERQPGALVARDVGPYRGDLHKGGAPHALTLLDPEP